MDGKKLGSLWIRGRGSNRTICCLRPRSVLLVLHPVSRSPAGAVSVLGGRLLRHEQFGDRTQSGIWTQVSWTPKPLPTVPSKT